MIIHIDRTCSAFSYQFQIRASDYKVDPKCKANAIIVSFKEKELTIPMANIICIEDE